MTILGFSDLSDGPKDKDVEGLSEYSFLSLICVTSRDSNKLFLEDSYWTHSEVGLFRESFHILSRFRSYGHLKSSVVEDFLHILRNTTVTIIEGKFL